MSKIIRLDPTNGVYSPGYDLKVYANGNPKKRRKGVDFGTVLAIQTSKSVNDVAGTFTITLKDERALEVVREMDVVRVRLRGHDEGATMGETLRGVVDEVRQGGSADVESAEESVVITGRCLGKYLQTTSLFLPVWDPNAMLPTAQMYGRGRPSDDAGALQTKVGTTPQAIFGHLLRKHTFGLRDTVGGGIPNSRFWLDYRTRFGTLGGFEVPFVQFDEDTLMAVLKTFEIPGFTEAWVDEIGRIVYRRPGWDKPARYSLPTGGLVNWSFARSDAEVATYVEVIPAGDPGINSAAAQALMAGRAPVPSEYVQGRRGRKTRLGQHVSPEFIIETSGKKVTAEGRRNHWYRLQRRLGVRPQTVSSPLIATQAQAQAQAEGLLEYYSRYTKTGQLTIPGDPRVRVGETLHLFGQLDGQRVNRTYYIEAVQHEYVEGSHYHTTIQVSHGRDPGDPKWGKILMPKYDPAALALDPGLLDSGPTGGGAEETASGDAAAMIRWAKSHVGVVESPPKSNSSLQINLWGAEFGYPNGGAAWCGIFLGYGLRKVCGINAGSGFPLVANIVGYGRNGTGGMEKLVPLSGIQPGDLVCYRTTDSSTANDHVALYIGDGECISGNFSDAVTRHSIHYSTVGHVVRPRYKR